MQCRQDCKSRGPWRFPALCLTQGLATPTGQSQAALGPISKNCWGQRLCASRFVLGVCHESIGALWRGQVSRAEERSKYKRQQQDRWLCYEQKLTGETCSYCGRINSHCGVASFRLSCSFLLDRKEDNKFHTKKLEPGIGQSHNRI